MTQQRRRGMHGLDFGFFGSGLRLLPTGSGVRLSFLSSNCNVCTWN